MPLVTSIYQPLLGCVAGWTIWLDDVLTFPAASAVTFGSVTMMGPVLMQLPVRMFIKCGLLGASVVSVVWMLKFWVLGSYVRWACPVGAFVRVAVPFGPVTGVGVGPDGVGDGVPGPVVGATVGVPGPGVGAGRPRRDGRPPDDDGGAAADEDGDRAD